MDFLRWFYIFGVFSQAATLKRVAFIEVPKPDDLTHAVGHS